MWFRVAGVVAFAAIVGFAVVARFEPFALLDCGGCFGVSLLACRTVGACHIGCNAFPLSTTTCYAATITAGIPAPPRRALTLLCIYRTPKGSLTVSWTRSAEGISCPWFVLPHHTRQAAEWAFCFCIIALVTHTVRFQKRSFRCGCFAWFAPRARII